MDLSGDRKTIRPRRTHRKSRLGCANCKRRRIKSAPFGVEITAMMLQILQCLFCFRFEKRSISVSRSATPEDDQANLFQCDEKRPSCANCSNHDIECTFSLAATPSADSSAPDESEFHASTPRPSRRFQPQQLPTGGLKQTFRISTPQPRPPSSIHSTGTQCDILKDSPQSTISITDLQLFHHWCISTFNTMAITDPNNVWQYHVVQWGIEFPSILHLILALSALHLAYEKPEQREKYLQQADDHFTFGVRTVTNVLSLQDLNESNCQKIYMSAVLIIFIYFGRGPRPGEYLIFSDNGPAEWGVLMQGVKMTTGTYHHQVFSGILKPEPADPLPEITAAIQLELDEHTLHTQEVERMIESELHPSSSSSSPSFSVSEPELESGSASDLQAYKSALKDLYSTMNQLYTRRSANQSGIAFTDLLIGWLYRLPARFVQLLEEKEPRALVVLAYWAVMFRYMDEAWFMKGWAEHVLGGVERFLGVEYRGWIEWPVRMVRGNEVRTG